MQSGLDPKEYGLALHTSSPQLGLALSNFAGESRSQTWDLGRDLSSHLHQYLAEFLKPQTWADLAFIAVAKGPGSFTSTRIGVVTARTLAQQLDVPLFAISTLAAIAKRCCDSDSEALASLRASAVATLGASAQIAWSHQKQIHPHPLAPLSREKGSHQGGGEQEAIALQMPAQRGQLYTAIYQTSTDGSGLTQLLPDAVMTPDSWKQALEALEMPYQLIDAPADLGNTAMSVLELAYLDWQQGKRPHWSEALPFYGQHPVEAM